MALRQVVRRENVEGPEAMRNSRDRRSHRATPLLSPGSLAELAAGMSQRLGRPVSVYLGWAYLIHLESKRRKPRPRHVHADRVAQETFKKS
jgi:hypothetical protein